jgi:hypothetical protein
LLSVLTFHFVLVRTSNTHDRKVVGV